MSLPLANVCRNKDDGIPAALRHPLIKNLKVGEKREKRHNTENGQAAVDSL